MARLYADEDFPFPVVERLRQLGHDVLTAFEAGQANQAVTDAAPAPGLEPFRQSSLPKASVRFLLRTIG